MPATQPLLLLTGFFLFALGTIVGSFVNVCVYRLPWQKSVIWPGSHCPRCCTPIPARDNVPILGWLFLGGRCRSCRERISARYPFVELMVGGLFVALLFVEVFHGPRVWRGEIPSWLFGVWFYHAILVALLVIGSLIDFDLTVIPDEVTVTGTLLGLALGTLWPWARPVPSAAATQAAGFWVGVTGMLAGGGLTLFVRLAGSLAFRKEAMGQGDVTLMAMIGAFLGWQAAVLTFFLAPFFGIAHAIVKSVRTLLKKLAGRNLTAADHEIFFGPYLSMAAVALILSWPWLWEGWGADFFATLRVVTLWLLRLEQ